MRYRYYSTQRPVGPGTYPKPQGNAVMAVHNYEERTLIKPIGRQAWGYVEYDKPLRAEDIKGYELTPETAQATN